MMIYRKMRAGVIIINKIFLLFIISALMLSCKEKEQKAEETEQGSDTAVILIDRSSVRLDPLLYSSVISTVKMGERVSVIGQSAEKCWIGNVEDYWYKIKISGGIAGWTFGTNLKIFSEKEADDIDDFLRGFWKSERIKMRKLLRGRWWSVDRYDHFTNQCLELDADGHYRAYCVECTPVEGDYEINFGDYEIILSKGSSFGNRLNYIMRGNAYVLKRAGHEEMKFRRIKRKIENAAEDGKSSDDEGQNTDQ